MQKLSEKAKSAFLLVGGSCMLLLLITISLYVVHNFAPERETASMHRGKVYQRTLIEGLRVSRQGCYGIDFIECGSCRIEKKRKGPFTFGGLNVLAIDDLKVVLPPKDDERNADAVKESKRRSSARDIARRLGVSDGFLKNNGLPLKFSGLRIKSLAVDRLLDYDSRPDKVFSAISGEAVRDGLSLSGCTIFLNKTSGEFVGKAMLSRSGGGLRLSWRGGELEI